MKHRFLEPIRIGNVEVKNRIMFLAMAKYYDNLDGTVSEKELEYVRSIAKGGTGLIVPGGMIVDPVWPSFIPMQPAIHDDSFLPGLKSLADAAHEYDAKILFQLWQGGECLYAGTQPPTVNDIDVDEIHRIQDCMVSAADRAIRAGADGVEVQICHNYIGSQFFSPLYNHRHDEYGIDSIENRLRFSLEYIRRIRKAIGPDKILAVKLQGDDYVDGGIVPADAVAAAPLIEAAGADMISVSGGGSLSNMFGMIGDGSKAEGWKVPNAAAVKAVVNIPVCATGSLRHPAFMDKIMDEGKCDMIGMGRGLFAEREFVNKCLAGKEHTLRYCMNCMNCVAPDPRPDVSTCSVNPEAGREYSALPLLKDGDGRTAVVIGAGPAGMEAAVTLKQRGFETVVFEKGDKIGGSMNLAKMPPNKHRFQWHIDYMNAIAEDLKIDVRLNTEATLEAVKALNPYAVIVASGSTVPTPPIPNLDKGTVYQSHDMLRDGTEINGKNVVVIGGGQTGVETALYLAAHDNKVTVVDFGPMATMDLMDPAFQCETLIDYMHCGEMQIPLMYKHKVVDYDGKSVTVENLENGETAVLPLDVLVLSAGVKPNRKLYDELVADGMENVFIVGDADVTGKIVRATQAGSVAAKALK